MANTSTDNTTRSPGELLDLINPERLIKDTWINILVHHVESHPTLKGTDLEYVGNHELHFDSEGRFKAITEESIENIGETREEFIDSLKQILADAEKYPTLSQYEFDHLFPNQWG